MKQRGLYLARQLSFAGTAFRVEEVALSKEFVHTYDESVKLVSWNINLDFYLESIFVGL